jgi:adenosylmethionine-8-amino-7-oxononanoate aminotransferase
VPPPAYYARIREICDRYGALFIADEVLTGAGRTGKFFALEHFKDRDGSAIAPDIITMGKGLNGGYAPLSAMIARSAIVETIAAGSGNFQHAQTYSHNPLGAAAALATMRYLDKHSLVERAARMGPALLSKLREAVEDSGGAQLVGDVRGIGMLAAVELVADRESKRPFGRALKVAERLVDAALARGLVVWPNVGHANGQDGDLVMIAPAFTISEEEIDELASRLSASLGDLAHQLAKAPA